MSDTCLSWTDPRRVAPRSRSRCLGIAAVQETLGDALAPVVLSELRHRGRDVVRGAPKLQLAAVAPNRPSGPRVAVERHTDAAGIDEVTVVRPRTPELQVAVAEDDLPLVDAGEQPNVVVAGLGREAVDVREWRTVAVERVLSLDERRQADEGIDLRCRRPFA